MPCSLTMTSRKETKEITLEEICKMVKFTSEKEGINTIMKEKNIMGIKILLLDNFRKSLYETSKIRTPVSGKIVIV